MEQLQTQYKIMLAIGLIAAGAALIVWAVRHFIQSSSYKKGILGLRQVEGMLKKYCAIRSFKVLSDVTLSDGKNTAHADHVVIGFFGIILLQNVQGKGEYFGDDALDQWTYIDEKGEKTRIPSPYQASLRAEEVLRRKFAQDSIYNVQIESYVVLSGDPNKTIYNGRKNPKIYTQAGLKKQLSLSKYEADNDVDVQKIADYLSQ